MLIAVGNIFCHEFPPALHPCIVLPGGIVGILDIGGGQNAGAGLDTRRLHHGRNPHRDIGEERHRPPANLERLADGLRGEFRRGRDQKHVGAGGLQLDDLGVDGRILDFVGRAGDKRIVFFAEHVLQPQQIIASEIVVLRDHREFGIGIFGQRMARVKPRLVAERPLHAQCRLRVLRDVGELRGTGADEQLRDVLALQIFGDRGVVSGADRGENQGDLVALHQPPGLLHGLRRGVAIVKRNQVDLAAVDAAALVDHLEIADLALA